MTEFVDRFSSHVFRAVREIDTVWDITGSEVELSNRIAAHLLATYKREFSIRACDSNRMYPGAPEQYDLFVHYSNGENIYVEVKCHWPTWWLKHNGRLSTYNKHLFSKTDKYSSLHNVEKVKRVAPKSATHVAVMLVGSYSIHPDTHPYTNLPVDFNRFEHETKVNALPWIRKEIADWPNPHPGLEHYRRNVRLYVSER